MGVLRARPFDLGFGDGIGGDGYEAGFGQLGGADVFDFGEPRDEGPAFGLGVAETARACGGPDPEDRPEAARGAGEADDDAEDAEAPDGDDEDHDDTSDSHGDHDHDDDHDHVLGEGEGEVVLVDDDAAEVKPDHAGGPKTDDGATTDDDTTDTAGDGFDITLSFTGFEGDYAYLTGAFTNAVAILEGIILADLPDVTLWGDETIDDVAIAASLVAIDGILGQAGPPAIRSDTFLLVTGVMEFDSVDALSLASEGT